MAAELKNNIRVHQTLHGYADGHRLLVASTTIKPRDQKTMLIMSDVSGAGATIDGRGYLTGYPLADSGMYALGRTWTATEMARPGCVWTHTLLVDFADLATLPTMNFLESSFLRPSGNFNIEDFSQLLTTNIFEDGDWIQRISEDPLERALAALYGFPKEKVVFSLASEDSAILAYAIWAQQWPRLRRNFRFCTASFADRSTEGAPFDLQFTPLLDRSYKSRFSEGIDANRTVFPRFPWIEEAVRDVVSGTGGMLRSFLKNVGGDVAGGRQMFAPLCSLYMMIPNFGLDPQSIDHAISLISSAFDSASAGSLRTLLVSEIARHPERLTEQSTDFLYAHLDLLHPDELDNSGAILGHEMWSFQPKKVLQLALSDSFLSEFGKSVISNLDRRELINSLSADNSLLADLVRLRPDILRDPRMWAIQGNWIYDAVRIPTENDEAVLNAIVNSGRSELAILAKETFGTTKVLRAIVKTLGEPARDEPKSRVTEWLDPILSNSADVAVFLNTQSPIPASILSILARRSHPDFIPNDVGLDPWANALSKISGSLDDAEQQYLCSYLLARAFGYRSHSQNELIEYGFDEVYFAALHERLARDAWQLLDRSLPRSWFFDWDYCQRLRNYVADVYVDRDLQPEGFSRITKDNSLFTELCNLASHNSRGRKYLKKVLRTLKDFNGSESRIRIIEDAI